MVQPLKTCPVMMLCRFFRFRKVHLQEISDKLWPRHSVFLNGSKDKITFEKEKYTAPFESLLLLVLYQFSRPRQILHEMDQFSVFEGQQ